MADVQVRGRRIEASLNEERPPFFELGLEPVVGQHLIGAALQFRDLFLDACHYRSCRFLPVLQLRNFSIVMPVNTMTYNPFL